MWVKLNGVLSTTIGGLMVTSIPPITAPPRRYNQILIDGRDGDITEDLGASAYDKSFTCLLHNTYDPDEVLKFFSSSGEVVFSNEPDMKYRYKMVNQIDISKGTFNAIKVFTVTMHVQPYKYPVNETPLTVSTTAWEGTDYDQTPYIFRAVSDSSVEVGNREVIEQITGGTLAWNQLCNASSVTIASGHKYYMKKGTAYSIGASTGAAITGLTSGSDMVIDITQMFGTAIADYIYNLEQSNAGAGVSLFKSLFPKDYYAYNAGELMSVKTSAHKTYGADDNALGTYPLSNIELRGIPKLANNKLVYDGDIYKADGSVTRRYGIVDLGTLSWGFSQTAHGEKAYYSGTLKNRIARVASNDDKSNVICGKYPTFAWNSRETVMSGIFGLTSGQIFIMDSNYQSEDVLPQFKASLSGVYLVYELASPTTETTTPYIETQICDADGTEEFIDDRDVQIPVGHKTKYKQMDDPAEITVPNAGNVPSAPTIQLTGSGTVDVYLNGLQIFSIDMSDGEITIDTEEMEATYQGTLANRRVTGDYSAFRLSSGDNTVAVTGEESSLTITNYSRWI